MRRLLVTSLLLLITAALPRTGQSQSVFNVDQSLVGRRELGLFLSGRVLSTEYSVEDGKTAFGGAVTYGTHLKSMLAVQGGLGINYSRQEYSYYKPPLWTFTPTISLILQRSTAADLQPYALIGAGYEFVRFTKPRCDCEQSRSLGVGNVGVGFDILGHSVAALGDRVRAVRTTAPGVRIRAIRGVVPAGRVHTPPHVQVRPSRLTPARYSCSPLPSVRWASRSHVVRSPGVPAIVPP